MKLKILFMCCLAAVCGLAAVAEQPHIQRSGINLVTNLDFSGNTIGWTIGSGVAYDGTVSRDTGTGSIKMTAAGNAFSSDFLATTPGDIHSFAFYMRSSVFPSMAPEVEVTYYNSFQSKIRSSMGVARFAVTASNSWQECVFLVRPQSGEVYARFKVWLRYFTDGYTGACWIDNFYFSRNIGFEQAPTAKMPFNGTQTKVDELGNVEIFKNGGWKPFFPIAVYGGRADYSVYSNQGFNMEMRNGDYGGVQNCKNAVSAFNPDGMISGFDLSDYIVKDGANYNKLTLLQQRLNDLKDSGLMNSIVWYYWDNEAYGEWTVPKAVTDIVRAADRDTNNNLMHPIYALQGIEGVARMFSNSQINMIDIVGDYVTQDTVSAQPGETRGSLGLVILGNLEGQRNPLVVAQLNHGVGKLFRPRVFNAIAKGAKGIGFWKDDVSSKLAIPIENQPWWNDLPNIRREIDLLLPVIRMPHWTNWSLISNNNLTDYGVRDYLGQGYVIVTNEQSTAQNVTFSISRLPYIATKAKNFFTNEIESAISANQFTVSIPSYDSKVYVLEGDTEIYIPPTDLPGPAKMPATGSKCDLIVNKVWWTNTPVIGQPLTVNFEISNIGTVKTAAGAGIQKAKVYLNNVLVDSKTYDDIAPKGKIALTATIPGASVVGGKQIKILVWADATNKVAEIRETNNTNSACFMIETRPDLIVKEITLSPKAAAHKSLTISFKISNVGAAATAAGAGAQIASVAVDGKSAGTVAYDDVLKGGSIAKQLALPGGIATAGTHKIKILADAANTVSEINENNNSLEKSFPIVK